jgi:hypothetical protein
VALAIVLGLSPPTFAFWQSRDSNYNSTGALVPYLVTGQVCNHYSGSPNTACTLPSGVVGGPGDLVDVYAETFGSVFATSVTDDKGDTCSAAVDSFSSYDSGGTDVDDFYCGVLTAGAKTFTLSDLYAGSIYIEEYRNVVGTLDGHHVNVQSSPGTAANAVTSGNISPAANGDLIVSGVFLAGGSGTANAGTGFTSAQANGTEYEVQPIATSVAGTWTATGTGPTATATFVMGFKHQ